MDFKKFFVDLDADLKARERTTENLSDKCKDLLVKLREAYVEAKGSNWEGCRDRIATIWTPAANNYNNNCTWLAYKKHVLIGGASLTAIIVGVVVFCCCCKRRQRESSPAQP